MLRLPLVALALALAPATASARQGAPGAAEARLPPNVVLVLADDLGHGELGCYGQRRIRTPRVDRLAAEGMRFTRHYAGSPVCAPSRCVLLTGLHTGHALVRDNRENGGWGPDEPEGQLPLPDGTPNLARSLRAAGYATGCFGKWGLGGPGTSGEPTRQGFDRFYGYLCQRQAHNHYPTHLWRDGEKELLAGNRYFASHQKLAEPLASEGDYYASYAGRDYAPERTIEAALRFVVENRERPFFLFFASPIPHAALQVPPEDLRAYPEEWDARPYLGEKAYLPHPRPRAAYAAMVSRLDRDVGRIVDLLDELGLAEDTLVMFTSDNGPTFNGGTDSDFFESTGGLRGRKTTVYEGGLRVPLVVRWPGRVAAGSVSDHVSAFEDLLPTLMELCGAGHDAPTDGLSFAPTLLGEEGQRERETLYWELAGRQALRAGRWKAVRPRVGKGDLALELYDLDADPAESTDLAAARPEVAARMEELLRAARVPSTAFPLPALDGD